MKEFDTILSKYFNPLDSAFDSVSDELKRELDNKISQLRSRLNGQSVLFTDAGRSIFDREVKDIFDI